jgi:endonuclease/exonuclease/phosphatase (EEP) superfamily protein YafD
MKNEGSILMLGDFNASTATNQAIILCNDSNPNTLWLDEELVLASNEKRKS